MQVWLRDKDRCGMVFIGSLVLNYDEPGPIDVDLGKFTQEQKRQLLYNWRRAAIQVDNPDRLWEVCGQGAAAKSYSVPAEKPLQSQEVAKSISKEMTPVDAHAQEGEKLKRVLKDHWATVKKNIVGMRPAQLRKLQELEKEGKGRKSILNVIEELLADHELSVAVKVGSVDVGNIDEAYAADPEVQRSTQVSNVVESDVDTITLIPSDEELQRANG